MASLIVPSRRGFLFGMGVGVGTLLAAPAIVRASSIMPVKALKRVPTWHHLAIARQGDDIVFFVDGYETSRVAADGAFAPEGVTWAHVAGYR